MRRPCAYCHRAVLRRACGYCMACYSRWDYHGRPEDGPPPPGAVRAGRVEDYAWLREQGYTRIQAAMRIGVSRRTAERYETALGYRSAA